jgi:propanediol dehydratase large subunit
VLQRDFEADGGLVPAGEDKVLDVRRRAVEALAAVLEELGLGQPTRAMKSSVIVASGSDDTESYTAGDATRISEAIRARGLTALDVVAALSKRGFAEEAENILFMLRQRVAGDYLQTSAVIRDGHVLSAVNDPNDYMGPGTGYRMSEARRREINGIRDVLDRETVLSEESEFARHVSGGIALRGMGEATVGQDPREVVIGVSPAFGVKLFRTLSGIAIDDLLKALVAGIEEGGGVARVVRLRHTADTSFLGLSAARLSGSKVGIGIQAKGTAVIHHAERLPHNNLELFSNAPITNLGHYRALGFNAARHAQGELPEPVVVPQHGEAMGSRFHARVALIYAIETSLTIDGAAPEALAVSYAEAAE